MSRGKSKPRQGEPHRRCLGCREEKPRRELMRIAARDGLPVLDTKKSLPGRGAWLCMSQRCAEVALKGRQVSRALKGKAGEPKGDEIRRWIATRLPLTPDPASG